MKGGEPKIISNTIIILNFEKVHLKENLFCIIDILILIYRLETKKSTFEYGNARNHYPGFESSHGKLQLITIMTLKLKQFMRECSNLKKRMFRNI